jgi:hypothetical protein
MKKEERLKEYKAKSDFSQTLEPKASPGRSPGRP